jgi:exonuclease SbcC
MIEMLVPQLEDSVNNILSRLSDFRVKIETQKSGIGKDVMLEGLFVTIINEMGEEMSFESYSGGEKIAITMSINEALASISQCNWRVMDESILALDDTKVEKFLEVLAEIQKNVRQVICISHIEEVKNFYDNKLEVVKINGNSIIK